MAEYVKIPAERIEVLLANKEKIKREIEKGTNTELEIDEEACDVEIIETERMEDPLAVWKARDIVKAIGRGFEPEIAMMLLDENNVLKVIDLKAFVGKSKNAAIRIKGRVIGREGKSKKKISEITDTEMVVYSKTVAIIGKMEYVEIAARAVDMLASGSMHGSAFKMVEEEMAKAVTK
ncbi:MAG: KH domain-containing protein [archaeon]